MPIQLVLKQSQKNALSALNRWLKEEKNEIGLIQMFCGVGKTHLFMQSCKDYDRVLIVFPRLVLENQFVHNYILEQGKQQREGEYYRARWMTVCSDKDIKEDKDRPEIEGQYVGITNPQKIEEFINIAKDDPLYIICTYSSLDTLLSVIPDNYFDMCIYDEAHRFTRIGKDDMELGFKKKGKKHILYTATPKNEGLWQSLIATPIFRYSHYDAVRNKDAKDFIIEVHLCDSENDTTIDTVKYIKEKSLLEGSDKVDKWLFYHSNVNEDNGVWDYIKKNESSMKAEGITHIGGDSKMSMKDRRAIIETLEESTNPTIVSSCGIISEGVDIKGVGGVGFINPRSSDIYITQAIGRACRIHNKSDEGKKGIVYLPIMIHKDRYPPNATKEDRDRILREQLNEGGDWRMLLNVCSALYQEDPELYEYCLKYPNVLAPKEMKAELKRRGFKIMEDKRYGDIIEAIAHSTNNSIEDIQGITNPSLSLDIQLQEISNELGTPIQIVTDAITADSIVFSPLDHNSENEPIRILHNSSDNEESFSLIQPLKKILRNEIVSDINKNIYRKKRQGRYPIRINKKNSPISVLWDFEEKMLDSLNIALFKETILDRREEAWMIRYNELKDYVKREGRIPKQKDSKLGAWCTEQRGKYNGISKGIITKEQIRLLELIPLWYWKKDLDKQWMDTYQELKEYVCKYNRMPRKEDNPILCNWFRKQRRNKKNPGIDNSRPLTEHQIALLELIPEWTWTKNDRWMDHYDNIIEFMTKNNDNFPKQRDGALGRWIMSDQRVVYKEYRNRGKCKGMNEERAQLLEKLPNWPILPPYNESSNTQGDMLDLTPQQNDNAHTTISSVDRQCNGIAKRGTRCKRAGTYTCDSKLYCNLHKVQ